MVGCVSSPSQAEFHDNQHEGHGGKVVQEVQEFAACSITQKPNLVLVNAGTNDCLQRASRSIGNPNWIAETGNRMRGLLDFVSNIGSESDCSITAAIL